MCVLDLIIVVILTFLLSAILVKDFPQISRVAADLLNSMKACPDFRSLPPSEDMKRFLARIEAADPSDTSIDEDNKGAGWGHHQFTAGSMTCASVMKSWEDIGNTTIARKLIASTVRTCKVARYVCEKMGIKESSYISDSYLERVIETLWDLWKLAGAVRHFLFVLYLDTNHWFSANRYNDFENVHTSCTPRQCGL
jgi:hypothetical protein